MSEIGKGQFSFQSQRRTTPKNIQPIVQFHSLDILAMLCSKSFKLGFSNMWTRKFQIYKLCYVEAEEPKIKLPTFFGSWRNKENSRKTFTSVSLITLQLFTMWITTNCGKFFKRWEYQTTLPVFWETCMQIKKRQLELDMEQNWDRSRTKYFVTLLI